MATSQATHNVHRCICFIAYDAPPSFLAEFDQRFPRGFGPRSEVIELLLSHGAPPVQYAKPHAMNDLLRRLMRAAVDEVAIAHPEAVRAMIRQNPERAFIRLAPQWTTIRTGTGQDLTHTAQRLNEAALLTVAAARAWMRSSVSGRYRTVLQYAMDALFLSGCARMATVEQESLTSRHHNDLRHAITTSVRIAVASLPLERSNMQLRDEIVR